MQKVACVLVFTAFSLSALGDSDVLQVTRANPPAGLPAQCEGFDAFVAVCAKPEVRWARRYVHSEDLGTSYPVNFLRVDRSEYIWSDGDLRWVIRGLDDRKNLSRSENKGYNFGAYAFVHEGSLHQVGGYGFWRNHADWITFMPLLGEWEINRVDGPAPVEQPFHACWQEGNSIHWLGLDAQVNAEGRETEWRTLDLDSKQWTVRGMLDLPMGQGWRTAFETEHYLILLDGSNGYALLRKSDGFVAIFSADQWAVDLWRASSAKGTMFNSGDVLGWTSPDGDVFTWDFAARAGGTVFLDYFMPVEPVDEAGMGLPAWAVFPVIGGAFAVLGWWLGRRKSVPVAANGLEKTEPSADALAVEHWSPALKSLLLQPERELLTAELDALLGILDAQSPDTLRARRARAIQSVNAEFELLFGYALIQRERGSSDRRKVIYRLAAPPSMVRKLLREKKQGNGTVTAPQPAAPASPIR